MRWFAARTSPASRRTPYRAPASATPSSRPWPLPGLACWRMSRSPASTRGQAGSANPWPTPQSLLDFVGLSALANEKAGVLPFGSLRLLGLALALATRPSLLLLDEPAAGLNDRETAALVGLVRQLPGPRHHRLRHRPRHEADADAVPAPCRARFRLQDRRRADRGRACRSEGAGSLSRRRSVSLLAVSDRRHRLWPDHRQSRRLADAWRRTRSSPSSAPTAPANRRCCAPSPG